MIIATFVCVSVVQAQSINTQSDNITWTISGLHDVNANVTVAYQCKFVTYANQSIDWLQDDGNYVTHFSIVSTEGQWPNPTATGSITYTIRSDDLTGSLTISNSGSEISVSLYLSGGTSDINHIYPVQSYEKI
jgi:hypothetical protein